MDYKNYITEGLIQQLRQIRNDYSTVFQNPNMGKFKDYCNGNVICSWLNDCNVSSDRLNTEYLFLNEKFREWSNDVTILRSDYYNKDIIEPTIDFANYLLTVYKTDCHIKDEHNGFTLRYIVHTGISRFEGSDENITDKVRSDCDLLSRTLTYYIDMMCYPNDNSMLSNELEEYYIKAVLSLYNICDNRYTYDEGYHYSDLMSFFMVSKPYIDAVMHNDNIPNKVLSKEVIRGWQKFYMDVYASSFPDEYQKLYEKDKRALIFYRIFAAVLTNYHELNGKDNNDSESIGTPIQLVSNKSDFYGSMVEMEHEYENLGINIRPKKALIGYLPKYLQDMLNNTLDTPKTLQTFIDDMLYLRYNIRNVLHYDESRNSYYFDESYYNEFYQAIEHIRNIYFADYEGKPNIGDYIELFQDGLFDINKLDCTLDPEGYNNFVLVDMSLPNYQRYDWSNESTPTNSKVSALKF